VIGGGYAEHGSVMTSSLIVRAAVASLAMAAGAALADTAAEAPAIACPAIAIESVQVVGDAPTLIMPGRPIVVKLKSFSAWLDCRRRDQAPMPVLYLDHVARPEFTARIDTVNDALRYSFSLGEQNRSAWAAAVGAEAQGQGVAVGLGSATVEASAIEQADGGGNFRMVLGDPLCRRLGDAYLVVLTLGSIIVAWLSRLVRDRGVLADGAVEWGRTYSLARTQLFLWSVVVAGVAGYLWITTGLLPALNVETLTLLGVSAGTTGGAQLLDRRGGQPPPVKPTSGFFLIDLLDDGQGASIHRFQAVLANTGLAFIFAIESLRQLDFYVMPPSWTAVLALSSGVYLGLKAREPGAGA